MQGHAELVAGGCRVGRKRVVRLMRESGLAGVRVGAGARVPRAWIAATARLGYMGCTSVESTFEMLRTD